MALQFIGLEEQHLGGKVLNEVLFKNTNLWNKKKKENHAFGALECEGKIHFCNSKEEDGILKFEEQQLGAKMQNE